MKIKLSQAVKLTSDIRKHIVSLKQEREHVVSTLVVKGESVEMPERDLHDITGEIIQAQEDLLKLESAIAAANAKPVIEWSGRKISIGEAIQTAKILRERAVEYERFGLMKDNEIDSLRSGTGTVFVRALLFDPKEFQRLAKSLVRKANRLSDLIDEANITTKVTFDRYSAYMGE